MARTTTKKATTEGRHEEVHQEATAAKKAGHEADPKAAVETPAVVTPSVMPTEPMSNAYVG